MRAAEGPPTALGGDRKARLREGGRGGPWQPVLGAEFQWSRTHSSCDNHRMLERRRVLRPLTTAVAAILFLSASPLPSTVRPIATRSGRMACSAARTSSRAATRAVPRTASGDGDFMQSDFDDLAAAGANYVQISHAGPLRRDAALRPRRHGAGEPRSGDRDGRRRRPVRGHRLPLGTGTERERHQQSRRDAPRDDLDGSGGARGVGRDGSLRGRAIRQQPDRGRALRHGRAEFVRASRVPRSG
jgi:hypothetical protein